MLIMAVPVKGTYCLCISNSQDQTINIGALGEILFQQGLYVYVGSALNSLVPRLERHIKTSQGEHHIVHWHIDYFLRENRVSVESIYSIETAEHIECKIAEKVSEHGVPIPHFGCSDCKCTSHLFKVETFDFLENIGLKKWV